MTCGPPWCHSGLSPFLSAKGPGDHLAWLEWLLLSNSAVELITNLRSECMLHMQTVQTSWACRIGLGGATRHTQGKGARSCPNPFTPSRSYSVPIFHSISGVLLFRLDLSYFFYWLVPVGATNEACIVVSATTNQRHADKELV